MIERFCHAISGAVDSRAMVSLESARSHTMAVSGASQAAAVRDVSDAHVSDVMVRDDCVRAIDGIEVLFHACARERKMLHESGLAPWTAPASRIDLRGYCHFAGPARDVVAKDCL
jgi:hypothetical protein